MIRAIPWRSICLKSMTSVYQSEAYSSLHYCCTTHNSKSRIHQAAHQWAHGLGKCSVYTVEHFCILKNKWNSAICSTMDGTGGHCIKGNMPGTEGKYSFTHLWKLKCWSGKSEVKRWSLAHARLGRVWKKGCRRELKGPQQKKFTVIFSSM